MRGNVRGARVGLDALCDKEVARVNKGPSSFVASSPVGMVHRAAVIAIAAPANAG